MTMKNSGPDTNSQHVKCTNPLAAEMCSLYKAMTTIVTPSNQDLKASAAN